MIRTLYHLVIDVTPFIELKNQNKTKIKKTQNIKRISNFPWSKSWQVAGSYDFKPFSTIPTADQLRKQRDNNGQK